MTQVSFEISSEQHSSGAAVLAVAGEFALVCADHSIVPISEIAGLDRVFPLHPTLDDSLTHVPLNAAS